MERSILETIKKPLGINEDVTYFDPDLTMHINTAIFTLTQLGVGPKEGFYISGPQEVWGDFLEDDSMLKSIETYIYIKVRLLFDPPINSFTIEALNKYATELEWRINVTVEGGDTDDRMG